MIRVLGRRRLRQRPDDVGRREEAVADHLLRRHDEAVGVMQETLRAGARRNVRADVAAGAPFIGIESDAAAAAIGSPHFSPRNRWDDTGQRPACPYGRASPTGLAAGLRSGPTWARSICSVHPVDSTCGAIARLNTGHARNKTRPKPNSSWRAATCRPNVVCFSPKHRIEFLNEVAALTLSLKAPAQTERACQGVRRTHRTGTQTVAGGRRARGLGKSSGTPEKEVLIQQHSTS
jgi:hypothetical protein